jgi:hypothetical protein
VSAKRELLCYARCVKPEDHLFQTVYRFYPRGIRQDDPRWLDTDEHRHLVDARLRAGAERGIWRTMLDRIQRQFDCEICDGSLHLISGSYGACYSAELVIPERGPEVDRHVLGFMLSFLVPYYVIYSYRRFKLDPVTLDGRPPATRLEANESELVYWHGIAAEIEKTYGADPMPVHVGHIKVEDVMPDNRAMGEAMIYDCIFSDNPRLISQDDEFALLLHKAWIEERRKREM